LAQRESKSDRPRQAAARSSGQMNRAGRAQSRRPKQTPRREHTLTRAPGTNRAKGQNGDSTATGTKRWNNHDEVLLQEMREQPRSLE
jgi:hypothetical protein